MCKLTVSGDSSISQSSLWVESSLKSLLKTFDAVRVRPFLDDLRLKIDCDNDLPLKNARGNASFVVNALGNSSRFLIAFKLASCVEIASENASAESSFTLIAFDNAPFDVSVPFGCNDLAFSKIVCDLHLTSASRV